MVVVVVSECTKTMNENNNSKKKHCINITSSKKKHFKYKYEEKKIHKRQFHSSSVWKCMIFCLHFHLRGFSWCRKRAPKEWKQKRLKMKLCTSEIHFMFMWLFCSLSSLSRFYHTRNAKHWNLCNFFCLISYPDSDSGGKHLHFQS